MAKTKNNTKNDQKKTDFLCILIQKLKCVAPGSGWWENYEFFFGEP